MAALVVPRHPDGGARDADWSFCARRWAKLHPELDIIEASDGPGFDDLPWSKTTAVNRAVAACDHEILVICDADLVVDVGALNQAIQLASAGWAVPHAMVYRLDADTTVKVLDGPVDVVPHDLIGKHLTRPAYYGRAGGGVIVVARWAWDTVKGFDERFQAWGGEDVALGWALRAVVGPGLRINSPLWHLWHPQQSMFRDDRLMHNLRLERRYADAVNDPGAIARLIAERP